MDQADTCKKCDCSHPFDSCHPLDLPLDIKMSMRLEQVLADLGIQLTIAEKIKFTRACMVYSSKKFLRSIPELSFNELVMHINFGTQERLAELSTALEVTPYFLYNPADRVVVTCEIARYIAQKVKEMKKSKAKENSNAKEETN